MRVIKGNIIPVRVSKNVAVEWENWLRPVRLVISRRGGELFYRGGCDRTVKCIVHIANHLLCNLCFVAHSSHVEDLTEYHILRASSEFISPTSHNPVKRCVFNVSAFELSPCQLYFVFLCWFNRRIVSYRKIAKNFVSQTLRLILILTNCANLQKVRVFFLP